MQHKTTIKASIIGVTGYTGLELLRLLLAHPHVEIGSLTSRRHDGEKIGTVYPHLAHLDHTITNTDHKDAAQNSDIVFLCLPHKTSQDAVADIHGTVKVIDLSADYRLDNAETYEQYYAVKHNHPALLDEVVYGLPEVTERDKIKQASTVANPGCFAALTQMMLFPFRGIIAHADIMAITGSSGSGKSAGDGTHHPIRNHNLKSYNVNIHRHIPEITKTAQISKDNLNFVPTSGPFTRGIFAQAFLTLKEEKQDIQTAGLYTDEPFIKVLDTVALANIVGSNYTHLSYQTGTDGRILVQGALDNLVKGAAGTAVQNMNLMFGLHETTGLSTLAPVYP